MSDTATRIKYGVFSIDVIVKGFVGMVVAATLALSGWSLKETYSLRVEFEKQKGDVAAAKMSYEAEKLSIDRRFLETEKRLDRTDIQNTNQYNEIKRMFEKLSDKIDRLQTRDSRPMGNNP